MPELDPLPPPPRRPSLAPRPGDFDDLTRRAAKRRHARYGAAGSAVVVAAGIALVLSGGTPGLDVIEAEPASPSTASATPSVTPSAGRTATMSASPLGDPPGSPTPGGTATSGPTPSATAAASPTEPPAGGEQPPGPHATLRRDDVAYTAGSCAPSGGESPGWCVRTPSSRTVQSGEPSDYLVHACRLPGSGGGTITFYSRDELSVSMYDQSGTEAYRFGDDRWPGVTHTATVGAGRCAQWTFTYDATDKSGRPLRAGDYSGGVSIHGSLSGPATTGSSYSFQVRVVD